MVCTVFRSSPPAFVATCLLAACLIENPAYKSTGTSVSGTSTGGDSSSTGDPTCPDGQPPRDWYPDEDEDGHGAKNTEPVIACEAPPGFVESHGDCKDDVASVNPDAEEICNERDDNCDGPVDGPQCGECKIETSASHVYWICPVPKDEPAIPWTEAQARCGAFSNRYPVDLLSVHTNAEHTAVAAAVQAYLKKDKDGLHRVWIGLQRREADPGCDPPPNKDSDWRWSDGTAVDFTSWIPMQPSNTTDCTCGESMCPQETCVELQLDVANEIAGWNDVPCDATFVRGYVCKTKRDPDLFPGN